MNILLHAIKQNTFFLIGLLFPLFGLTQNDDTNYIIDIISSREGLSHNYTSSIVSDSLNIKWIGTENGITKYDGFNFKYIKPSEAYKNLKNENIEVLFKENANRIWIGTKSGGLSCLNIRQDSISNYNFLINSTSKDNLSILSLAQDSSKNIWAGTLNEGIYIIDYINNKLIKHINIESNVLGIIKDTSNNMWYASKNTIYKYNPYNGKTTQLQIDYTITDLALDKIRNRIWIGTAGSQGRLYYLDLKTNNIEYIQSIAQSNFGIIFSLDHHNRLWVGTWRQGLYRSNTDLSSFDKIRLVPNRSEKIETNYNSIIDIHHDQNNITWVATTNGGIVKLIEPKGFNNLDIHIKPEQLKGDFNIQSMYRDPNHLFIGTCKKGVFYGTDHNKLKPIEGIGEEKIFALKKYKNKILIGSTSGLYAFDLNTKKIVFKNASLRKVTAIHIDQKETLYLGTQHDGVAIVPYNQISNKQAYQFYSNTSSNNAYKIKSSRITSIAQDTKNNIWFGTYNGVHLFNINEQKFYSQSQLLDTELPSIIINELKIKDDAIWIATPGGLFKLIYNNNKLSVNKHLTKKDGLNTDFICALDFDEQNNLWLSANTEIVKYNEKTGSYTTFQDVDGIRTTSFNNGSVFKDNKNTIYFGGVDNITFFNPDKVLAMKTTPQIIFTNLRVNNENVNFKNKKKKHNIINEDFGYTNTITLNHKDNFFSIDIIPNDFLGNDNINYQYKLEGQQNNWINIKNWNELNFTGLNAGKYTLRVAATRDNQNWLESKSIDIIIKNSPWRSPWAFFGYALLLAGLLYISIRIYKNQLVLKNKLQLARIDREKEIRLSEAKLNFFTNMSHEFRTPLTLIASPLSELMESSALPIKVLEKLKIIDRNTNRLLDLVNQLLDFRKADYGLLKLNASSGDFVSFANEVFLYFKEVAKTKNITYTFTSSNTNIEFPFDRNKMEIVLCNLLSNALKYCREGDSITFSLNTSQQTNSCLISIKDSGPGIAKEDLNKIFDRFYQIKSANTAKMIGSGIGLHFSKKIVELHHGTIKVNSKKGKGAEFIIKLAMQAELYKDSLDTKPLKTNKIEAYNLQDKVETIQNLNLANTKKPHLLIIDDNRDILNYLRDILYENYNLTLANDGIEGFEKASKIIPDLIISDVMMPRKDGLALCKELKEQITTSHIPIILLTARTATVFEIEGLKTGADDYITKPFNPTSIKARITTLLENRLKLREHLLNKVRFEPTISETEKNNNPEDAFINKAISIVENNLKDSNFGVEKMVEEFYMSQSTLYRKIKSLTGLSISGFIRSIRLKKAAQLILTKDMTLSQIAYEVGFNDYKYFKTSFKKQFNCLPSKYKEVYNKN